MTISIVTKCKISAVTMGFAIAFSSSAQAQQCGWFNAGLAPNCSSISAQNPSNYVETVIENILKVTRDKFNVPKVLTCRSPGLRNAMALQCPTKDGPDARIFYDPFMFAEIDVRLNNEMALIGLLAHEIGHFVDILEKQKNPKSTYQFGHTYAWSKELRADRHAGYVLAKLGAVPKDVEALQRYMFSWGTFSHPDAIKRISAMFRGYKEGGGTKVSSDTKRELTNRKQT